MVGRVATMVPLAGPGIDDVELRERPEGLRNGGIRAKLADEVRIGSKNPRRIGSSRTNSAVEDSQTLGDSSKLREIAGTDLVVVQQTGLQVLAHHAAVSNLRNDGIAHLALYGEIEIIESRQFGSLITRSEEHMSELQ